MRYPTVICVACDVQFDFVTVQYLHTIIQGSMCVESNW